jgi:xanthine/CO dehydrogenase XdhC/CoxF family maturation factor
MGWKPAPDMQSTRRILVVAHRSVATPALVEELRWRSFDAPCEFVLLIPHAGAAAAATAEWTLRRALRLFEHATRQPVEALFYHGDDDAQAIVSALSHGHFDEVIISTLPAQVSQWLCEDVPAGVDGLGVTVTVVTPEGAAAWRASAALGTHNAWHEMEATG